MLYRIRTYALLFTWPLLLTAMAIPFALMRIVAPVRGRRLAWDVVVKTSSRLFLKAAGVTLDVRFDLPDPKEQQVIIFNHSSSMDLFIIGALGFESTRTFMKRSMCLLPPLGVVAWAAGTFFTVPQKFQEKRRILFKRACDSLKKTKDSVALSPEGTRHSNGVGPFNKGAFHLALELGVPVFPIYIDIADSQNPGKKMRPKEAGVVVVHALKVIKNEGQSIAHIDALRSQARALYLEHEARGLNPEHNKKRAA